MPKVVDELYIKKDAPEMRPKLRKMDEDRTFKKKFKPKPTSAQEVRECSAALPAQDLMAISTYPREMDFGSLCVQSRGVKNLCVSNDTRRYIIVSVETSTEE